MTANDIAAHIYLYKLYSLFLFPTNNEINKLYILTWLVEKLKEDEKTRLKIISAMDQMRYGYLNALFLYIYNQKCYQKQKPKAFFD